jgi:hypothetical protein
MMRTIRNCDECGREYYAEDPKKPGRFSVCDACGADGEITRVKGFMIADSKCSSSILIDTAEKIDELRRVARIGSVVTH